MWYEIPGFPGYRISQGGEILSTRAPGGPMILKQWPVSKNGIHLGVSLRKDGRYHQVKVHILVARTFLGPKPPGLDVCHNNGNGHDNRHTNLRYDTRSENNLDQVRHGTHPESSRTHCDSGHEFTPENTMWRWGKPGKISGVKYRKCKTCHARYIREWRARKAASALATASGHRECGRS